MVWWCDSSNSAFLLGFLNFNLGQELSLSTTTSIVFASRILNV
jgi:hypothetical protein